MKPYFSLVSERLTPLDIYESESTESVHRHKININIFILSNVPVSNTFCFIFRYLLEMKNKIKKNYFCFELRTLLLRQ